jgi:hypothetical protein
MQTQQRWGNLYLDLCLHYWRYISEGDAETSHIFLRNAHVLPKRLSYWEISTGGKPIAVWLQSITSVTAVNFVAFYYIYGSKGELLFFFSVPDTTKYIYLHYNNTYISLMFSWRIIVNEVFFFYYQWVFFFFHMQINYKNLFTSQVSFFWKLKNDNDSLTDEEIWQSGTQSFLKLSTNVDVYRTYLCFANNSVGMSRQCEMDVVGKILKILLISNYWTIIE